MEDTRFRQAISPIESKGRGLQPRRSRQAAPFRRSLSWVLIDSRSHSSSSATQPQEVRAHIAFVRHWGTIRAALTPSAGPGEGHALSPGGAFGRLETRPDPSGPRKVICIYVLCLPVSKLLKKARSQVSRDVVSGKHRGSWGGTWKGILTLAALLFVKLIPFSFTELRRVFGAGRLIGVFFRPRYLLNLPQNLKGCVLCPEPYIGVRSELCLPARSISALICPPIRYARPAT